MKMGIGKMMSGAEPAKEQGAFRLSRARSKKRETLFATKDFWRALSSASLPQAPTLRRLHD